MIETVDLSKLNIDKGSHNIRVKARAWGYVDSEFSNSEKYVVNAFYFYIIGANLTFEAKFNMQWSNWILTTWNSGYIKHVDNLLVTDEGKVLAYEDGTPVGIDEFIIYDTYRLLDY